MPAYRIGHGYDVHRLVGERPLIIGGVRIPYSSGLDGHSDADVLTHAIMDAVLGAIGLGDIGRHFPDTDLAYTGCDSIRLARVIRRKMIRLGYKIGNIDSTVIAQRPHLAPYIDDMRRRLAMAFGSDPSLVSIKATTEEGLGFTGSGEAIAAHAVVLLEKKTRKPKGRLPRNTTSIKKRRQCGSLY